MFLAGYQAFFIPLPSSIFFPFISLDHVVSPNPPIDGVLRPINPHLAIERTIPTLLHTMSTKDALQAFIKDTPPGEISAVQNDIANITDSAPLQAATQEAIAEFLEQAVIPVKLPNGKRTVVSKFNRSGFSGEYFSDNSTFRVKFENGNDRFVNGLAGTSSAPALSSAEESLKESLKKYVAAHFPSESACDVFPQSDGSTAVVIVDYGFSPENMWNGKWVSQYIVNGESVTGEILIDVHYYEDGNVRLKSSKKIEADGPAISAISQAESAFQAELNKSLIGLNEHQFKALRRQLPVTRSKVNWGKAIGNYRLGKDIGGQ